MVPSRQTQGLSLLKQVFGSREGKVYRLLIHFRPPQIWIEQPFIWGVDSSRVLRCMGEKGMG